MKIFSLFFLLFIGNGSFAQKSTIIPYFLSIEAEKSIYDYIKSQPQDSIAFLFESLDEKKYIIHLSTLTTRFADSNRKLFINDRFYPIYFDSDNSFFVRMQNDFPAVYRAEDEKEEKSTLVKMPDIEERLKNKNLYFKSKVIRIIDWSTTWTVDREGNLLETNSK